MVMNPRIAQCLFKFFFVGGVVFFSWVMPVKIRQGGSDGASPVWAAPSAWNSFEKLQSPKDERRYQKRLKARGQTDVRRWLYLFGALSTPAALFLFYRSLSAGTNLPENIERSAVKVCAAVLLVWIFLYLYHITGAWFWLAVIPWTGIGAVAALGWPFARRYYRLKLGVASFPGGWICANCGIENDKIFLECLRCRYPKKN